MENINDEDLIKESTEAFSIFLNSLGEDSIYKDIVIEELLKILLRR
jgi:hypothetical protein